jgi:hypothetical protein
MMANSTWRVILAVFSGLVFGSLLLYGAISLNGTPVQIKLTKYDAYRAEALKMKREQSAGSFQIAVAILGALWATMIVSADNRLKTSDRLASAIFVMATLVLMAFLYFNWSYGNLLAQLYWDMGPDLSAKSQFADVLNSKYVSTRQDIMQSCLYAGLLLSALSVVSGCLFREDK